MIDQRQHLFAQEQRGIPVEHEVVKHEEGCNKQGEYYGQASSHAPALATGWGVAKPPTAFARRLIQAGLRKSVQIGGARSGLFGYASV